MTTGQVASSKDLALTDAPSTTKLVKRVFKRTVAKTEIKKMNKALGTISAIELPKNIEELVAKARTIASLLKITDPKFNELGHRHASATFVPKSLPIDTWLLGLVTGKFELSQATLSDLLDQRKATNTNAKEDTLKAWCDKIVAHMGHFTGQDTKVSFLHGSLAHQYDATTAKQIANNLKGVCDVVRSGIMVARKTLKEPKAAAPAK